LHEIGSGFAERFSDKGEIFFTHARGFGKHGQFGFDCKRHEPTERLSPARQRGAAERFQSGSGARRALKMQKAIARAKRFVTVTPLFSARPD
jgi:hypothetical protein